VNRAGAEVWWRSTRLADAAKIRAIVIVTEQPCETGDGCLDQQTLARRCFCTNPPKQLVESRDQLAAAMATGIQPLDQRDQLTVGEPLKLHSVHVPTVPLVPSA
jgi:hypothetical protein